MFIDRHLCCVNTGHRRHVDIWTRRRLAEVPNCVTGANHGHAATPTDRGQEKRGMMGIQTRFGAASAATTGFHGSAAVDESPARLQQTRLAVARAKEGDRDALHFLYVR